MAGSTFSSEWYRVAQLKPRLRAHARMHRHRYRGQVWYVLEDLSSERYHRFSPEAYRLVAMMDGKRSVAEIWEAAGDEPGEDAPTQDELIGLLGQLHQADALQTDITPDTRELFDRHDRQRKGKLKSQLLSPLFWRIPLYDPERLLVRLLPFVRPLFSVWGAVAWLAVVATGLFLAAMHWHDLTHDFTDRVMEPGNLLLVWLLFPVIKCLHEFGHAFLTKLQGGEVHEMGVMLLVITPLPYVDASSSSAFRNKRERVLVGAGGMIVELFLASLAMMVWVTVEPGTVRALAYNAIMVAGVSTLLFNANPLLRFDGYYILSDLIEIPNLRPRSTRFLTWLGERYLLGHEDAVRPHATRGEAIWFVSYGICSFIYRVLVIVGIILFIASRFFFVGVVLALWSVVAWGLIPLGRGLHGLFTAPRLRRVKRRTAVVCGGGVAGLLAVTCLLPIPLNSRAEGVIWVPEKAIVRAGTDGFVRRVVATPGERVQAGDVLFECDDPLLRADLAALEAREEQVRARLDSVWFTEPAQAEVVRQELASVEESLSRTRGLVAALTIRSPVAGDFVAPDAQDYVGVFLRRGTPIARVIDLGTLTARVVVRQDDIDLVRQRTQGVEARLAERVGVVLPATVRREVPAASDQLPTTALGAAGGGQIAVDPGDSRGTKSLESTFQFDVELPSDAGVVNVGGRVHVRFHHGWEPVAFRWYRQVRQLFLSRFAI
jgi:putative peptide zinc metalloprotease protein